MPDAEVRHHAVPAPGCAGLHRTIGLVVHEFQYRRAGGVQSGALPIHIGIGSLERRNANGAEPAGCQPEANRVGIGTHVIADVVVRTTEPERVALAARIRRRSAVAAARRELARAPDPDREVVVEHVERFVPVLGHDAGACRAVDDVVLDQPVVTVVDRDAPLRRVVNRVADQRELISVGRRHDRTEVVMEMNRVTPDLVRLPA